MPTPKISLLPDKLDLALYAGDGAIIKLTVTDNANVLIPLSGAEITAQIRATRLDPDALVEFTPNTDDSQPGVILLSLYGDQTASLITDALAFRGVWDVQWHPENKEPVTLVQGKVECDADVTR